MTRGYFGWQPANDMEERRFERELAKRAGEYSAPGNTDPDTSKVQLPWVADGNPDRSTQTELDKPQPTRSRTTAKPKSG